MNKHSQTTEREQTMWEKNRDLLRGIFTIWRSVPAFEIPLGHSRNIFTRALHFISFCGQWGILRLIFLLQWQKNFCLNLNCNRPLRDSQVYICLFICRQYTWKLDFEKRVIVMEGRDLFYESYFSIAVDFCCYLKRLT